MPKGFLNVSSVGAINLDVTLFVDSLPRPGGQVLVKSLVRMPGGKGANVAIAASRFLNGGCGLVGALGDDEIARVQLEKLVEEGVDTTGVITIKGAESNQAFVVVDESGENMIFSYHSATRLLTSGHARDPGVLDTIRRSRVVVVLDNPPGFMNAIIDVCRGLGRVVVLAPGVRTIEDKRLIGRVLGKVDYLLLNEHEARQLTGERNLRKALDKVLDFNRGLTIIVTLGPRGAVAYNGGQTLAAPGVDLARVGLRVRSTVGCGDAFTGVFASMVSMGSSLPDALTMANLAGALKATRISPRDPPRRSELEDFKDRLDGLGVRYSAREASLE